MFILRTVVYCLQYPLNQADASVKTLFVKFSFKQTSVTARCYLAVYRQVSTNVLKYIKYELNKLFVEE